MSKTMEPHCPQWVVAEPGRLVLQGTRYAITWSGYGSFITNWDGHGLSAFESVQAAKDHISKHSQQLLEMGFDPAEQEDEQP